MCWAELKEDKESKRDEPVSPRLQWQYDESNERVEAKQNGAAGYDKEGHFMHNYSWVFYLYFFALPCS